MTWFFLGLAALLGAYIFGKVGGIKETKTKISGQVIIEKQKAEKAEKEKDIALETAQIVQQKTANDVAIEQYFNEFERERETAQETNDVLSAIEAARKLAERAEAWRQRNSL